MSTPKVLLLTSIVAPHRIAAFNALAVDPAVDFEVVFLARTDPSRTWEIRKDEMRFSHRTLREVWRTRHGEAFMHLTFGLATILREARPDVLLVGGWDQLAHLEAFALRRRVATAFVWWVESTLRDRRENLESLRQAKRWLVEASDAVVVPGLASAAYVRALGAVPSRVFVAPNAVDNGLYAARAGDRASRTGPVRFLFVGRLEPSKGILALLDAWTGFADEAELTLVGDGSLLQGIRERVTRAAMPSIRIPGHIDREGLAAEYARADVFVFPSVSDPWGLVINEAMASGLPVVTTSAPGAVDDLVIDGENGIVVPPFDAGALRAAMECLARDPGRRRAMGRRSADRIRTQTPEAWAVGMREAALASLDLSRTG
jgi:glycosyltransferase involved in cell wall biosynthesis